MNINRQKGIHCAGHSDQRPLDPSGGGEGRNVGADVRRRQAVDINVRAGAGTVGIIGWVQSFLPLALGDFPELGPIEPPQRGRGGSGGDRQIRWITGPANVLRGRAARVVSGSDIVRIVQDRGRQGAQNIGSHRIDECALPVYAAVE